MLENMQDQLNFLKVALKDHRIGAMTRSSKYVVSAVMRHLDKLTLNHVIEYGPGDGVITHKILERLSVGGKLDVIETNLKFIKELQTINDTRLKIIKGTAQEVTTTLMQNSQSSVDAIISSIPFSMLEAADRERLVRNTLHLLKPSGRFIVFQYSPMLLTLLNKYFSKTHVKTEFELRNVPPNFIMTAWK
jgi:phospholipid N-methyltransferase